MAEESAANLVEYACKDQVATLTLNRPHRLNAFSDELVRQLADALRRFDLDPEAQVAVICGNGRAFSSGADVHQRQLRKREEFLEHGGPQGWGANSGDLLTRSVNWKPVIAAPHGYAMGLALGIVLECDLIVAAAGTKFQVTETSRGLGGAKYWALLNFRGAAAFATEVTLTGRFFTAEEALAAGIINRVAPEGRHLETPSRNRLRARRRSCQEPAALGARDGAHPPLAHGPARARSDDADRPLEALPVGGLPGSRPRLCRKAQARPVQGPLSGGLERARLCAEPCCPSHCSPKTGSRRTYLWPRAGANFRRPSSQHQDARLTNDRASSCGGGSHQTWGRDQEGRARRSPQTNVFAPAGRSASSAENRRLAEPSARANSGRLAAAALTASHLTGLDCR